MAADDSAVDRIVLAAGTYDLTRTVSIGHALTIEAEAAGTVVLDAKGLFGPVVSVQGTATLSGLNLTGGVVTDGVSCASGTFLEPSSSAPMKRYAFPGRVEDFLLCMARRR